MKLADHVTSKIADLISGLLVIGAGLLALRATGLYLGSLLTESSPYALALFSIGVAPAFMMAFTVYGADAMAKDIKSRLHQASKKGADE
tara:strand:- start:658 stop:924 length:267 start_codon:yes stop_codon:yes gene_type:complete